MIGRTYRYATHEPLFPFGFGLSYTSFEYQDLKIIPYKDSTTDFRVIVTLKNVGSVAADEVVQLYLRKIETRLPAPLNQLIAFQRVSLKAGQVKSIHFNVTSEMLMIFDEDGQQKLEPGKFLLTAGGCSPSARGVALGAPQPVNKEFIISK
jgi:beta-glucosidase